MKLRKFPTDPRPTESFSCGKKMSLFAIGVTGLMGLAGSSCPLFLGRICCIMSLVWSFNALVSSQGGHESLANLGEFWWLTWADFIMTKLPVRYSPRMVMIVRELSPKCRTKFRFRMNGSGIILSCPDHISNPQVSSSSLSFIKRGVLFHTKID